MAKLSKMELKALATRVVKDIAELQLPILLAKWEEKSREVENLPAFLEYKAWTEKYPELLLSPYHAISLETLKVKLGAPLKPSTYNCSKVSTQEVIDSLIIAQITDSNMVDVIEQVKQSFSKIN